MVRATRFVALEASIASAHLSLQLRRRKRHICGRSTASVLPTRSNWRRRNFDFPDGQCHDAPPKLKGIFHSPTFRSSYTLPNWRRLTAEKPRIVQVHLYL